MSAAPGLADVLPAVAAALGYPVRDRARTPLTLAEARHVVVVLLDGLGAELLGRRRGHAPFLRALGAAGGSELTCAFPSTTATSMGCLGTGMAPGQHGLVGLEVLDPELSIVFSELAWDPRVDPRRWQPAPTVFELLAAQGVEVARIGPSYFDGSGLTEAALRGGRFVAAADLDERVDATLAVLREAGNRPALVYLYWGEIDKVGHVHGCQSWQWGAALAEADAAVQRLVERAGPRTCVIVTADHGMVDVAFTDRLDVADEPDLAAGIRHVGGEPRALHLYCRRGAADDVLAAWSARLGPRMELVSRQHAVDAGWFGEVREGVLHRIGDVIGSAVADVAVVDSRTARPESLALLGLHGARTDSEVRVPFLVSPAA